MATQRRLRFALRANADAAADLVPYEPQTITHIGRYCSGQIPDDGRAVAPVLRDGGGFYLYLELRQTAGVIEALAIAVDDVTVPDRGPGPRGRASGRAAARAGAPRLTM